MTVEGLEFEFISNENKNTNQMKPTHQTEHVYFYFQNSLKKMFFTKSFTCTFWHDFT